MTPFNKSCYKNFLRQLNDKSAILNRYGVGGLGMLSASTHTSLGGEVCFRRHDDICPAGTKPVVLVHRAGGSSRAWWPQIEAIGRRRQLVALDLPGHGESRGESLASVEQMADVVSEVIDGLCLEKAVVVGHSMGGAIALSLSLRHPAQVSSLLLVSSGAKLRVAKPLLDTIRSDFDMLPHMMATMAFSATTSTEVVEAHRSHLIDAPAEVVLKDLEACDSFDVEGRLGELTIPIVLMTGKDDFMTPPRLARRVVARAPNAQLKVVAETGHMLPLERPEIITEGILSLSAKEKEEVVDG